MQNHPPMRDNGPKMSNRPLFLSKVKQLEGDGGETQIIIFWFKVCLWFFYLILIVTILCLIHLILIPTVANLIVLIISVVLCLLGGGITAILDEAQDVKR